MNTDKLAINGRKFRSSSTSAQVRFYNKAHNVSKATLLVSVEEH